MTRQQIQEFEQLQQHLRQAVVTTDAWAGEIKTVAGVDVAYEKGSDTLIAAVAVLDAHTLALREVVSFRGEATFPYIPGLFSFRELPAVLQALEKLPQAPDLVVCDGQGLAHPRRFGLACHLGVATGIPTIGCAKTRLLGEYQPLAPSRGSYAELVDNGEVVGRALRTQTDKNPVFVSVGHNISLETATEWVLRLTPLYRLPETTRAADHAVNTLLRATSASKDEDDSAKASL
ncbi:deoxyribonuclease V [Hymenobacter sp. BT664]|uniref:Endonuclease V n=1 Tax=Hymenobacter montanus TaxID=2771359 RepID=A0A927BCJ6_9BACT|nr:deoxyribonuclease V [Hymenobacter montanus]MBD2767598.1 deoxyribonuclease V [Hymenobacter montanus]